MAAVIAIVSEVCRAGCDNFHSGQCCLYGISKDEFDTIKAMEGKSQSCQILNSKLALRFSKMSTPVATFGSISSRGLFERLFA